MEQQVSARDYLKKPYARRITPDDDGGYVATIQEFPGLVAEGNTADEAVANLDSAAESWIEAAIEMGQDIPDPISLHGYSGKVALRLPRGLHKRASEMAESEATSLNQWLVSAIAHYLGTQGAVRIAMDHVFKQIRQTSTADGLYMNRFYGINLHLVVLGTTEKLPAATAVFQWKDDRQVIPKIGAGIWPQLEHRNG
jgi:predicted RNase H-like HicB family nuclease